MSVFNPLYAEKYDLFYAEKNYIGECDLIESALKKFARGTPNTVIDIGCGTGSHAIELAKRGYNVTGVDLSQSMINEAEKKASSLTYTHPLKWSCGDARNFNASKTFDLGIMMFAVVGYLTSNQDVLDGLINIRKHLEKGALFMCDFWYGPSVLSVRPNDRVALWPTEAGKVLRVASTILEVPKHTAQVTFRLWDIRKDVVVETIETHSLRYFFPQEFALLLSCAGFEMKSISAFPSLDNPLNDETWNAFVVSEAV